MNKSLLEAVQIRVRNDYNSLIEEELKLDKKDLINSAYKIAHYNEINDLFDNLDCDDGYSPFDEEDCKKIVTNDTNIISKIWYSWLNYNHPEYYNFFEYENLIDIVKYAISH